MSNGKAPSSHNNGEPDSVASLRSLMKDPPVTREQHSQRLVKRGDVRRKIEDLLLEKSGQDLW